MSDNALDTDDEEFGDDDDLDVNTISVAHARSVLDYLVRSVVDDPDAVNVQVDESGRRTTLNVTVGDGDMGRVIGKRGRVATSIRTVTRAAAARDGVEIDIEFLD
ncbi:MAG: KH domain-containing protein [Actinomycetes bacterium]